MSQRSDLRTFEALLTDFFWLLVSPKHIVVVINSPIQMKLCFITKPNVIESAGSLVELFIQPVAHLDYLLFVLLLQHMMTLNSKREQLQVLPHDCQKCS